MAESEGVALNQLINVALAEKLSALRTEDYFLERIPRADRAETLRILNRSGRGKPPMEGDELPMDLSLGEKRARKSYKVATKEADQNGKLKRRLQKVRSR